MFEQFGDSIPKVDARELALYEKHYALLKEWNEKINLVSRKSIEKAFASHYVDSLYTVDLANEAEKSLDVHDIGSGAGFPGVMMAIRFPDRNVTLFEKHMKKQLFLTALVEALALPNLALGKAAPDNRQKAVYLARAVFQREELFAFMYARMTWDSYLVTNLGGTNPVAVPPKEFEVVKEIRYDLPLDCGPRKAELVRLVPRGTK